MVHREDGPAIQTTNGAVISAQLWYLNGRVHRENGPAAIFADGRKEWRKNGRLHRENGPAVKYPDGRNEWWENGIKIEDEPRRKVVNKRKRENPRGF